MTIELFNPKETIFAEGSSASCSWMVLSGSVRMLVFIANDRMVQTEILERGEILGLFCRLGGKRETFPCTAIAEGPVCAVRIPDDQFDRLYRNFPAISRDCFSLCTKRLSVMQRLVAFVRENSEVRVAEMLLKFHAQHGERVPATRHSLSLQTGMAIETVFRVLSGFRKKGWVKTGRGFIEIRKPQALRDLREKDGGP